MKYFLVLLLLFPTMCLADEVPEGELVVLNKERIVSVHPHKTIKGVSYLRLRLRSDHQDGPYSTYVIGSLSKMAESLNQPGQFIRLELFPDPAPRLPVLP